MSCVRHLQGLSPLVVCALLVACGDNNSPSNVTAPGDDTKAKTRTLSHPVLMMGFTADGEVDEAMLAERDRRMGIKFGGEAQGPPEHPGAVDRARRRCVAARGCASAVAASARQRRARTTRSFAMQDIPAEDQTTFDMICQARSSTAAGWIRKRLAGAERTLQSKPTKKAQDDQHIATEKIRQLMGRHADLKRTELLDRDSTIFPGGTCR